MFFSGHKKKLKKSFKKTIELIDVCFLDWKIVKKNPLSYLRFAAALAAKKKSITQNYYLGAIGIRSDGAMVHSFNGSGNHPIAEGHAEARLSHKLDVGSIVYVARYSFRDHKLAMAKPCPNCERVLISKGVKRVYYSIKNNEYGTMVL